MSDAVAEKKVPEEETKGGELLFCGGTAWDILGRRRGLPESNLVSPTRLRPLVGVNIRFVATGCASCHCVALDDEGRCYTWGRNEKGQLGHGDTIQRDRPTVVSGLSKYKIVNAGVGRNHTVVVTEDGTSLAFGWNKHGQLGSGSTRNEIESSPVRCQVSEVNFTACGAEFTVWLSSVEGATIVTAGLPQYGQLGHGTDNEYNIKDSSVKLAYEAQSRPRAIVALAGETIVKVACGTNHTVAVDKNGHVYTWGFGGYGRLGHREQKDEWLPRRVDVFQRNNILPPDAVVSAGAANSACTAGGGQLYMWGKMKNTGDDWMYPKPVMDLSGWNIRCMASGSMHHFVGADNSCISWGVAQNGELGYGPNGQKSSANAKKVDILESIHVISVGCGLCHSMVIVDRESAGDRLDQLDIYDGKAATEEVNEEASKPPAVNHNNKKAGGRSSDASKKRKKSKESSDEEEEEVEGDSDGESDDDGSDEQANGHAAKKRGGKASGRGRGKGSGRGRGRSSAGGNKKRESTPVARRGTRGRPRN